MTKVVEHYSLKIRYSFNLPCIVSDNTESATVCMDIALYNKLCTVQVLNECYPMCKPAGLNICLCLLENFPSLLSIDLAIFCCHI